VILEAIIGTLDTDVEREILGREKAAPESGLFISGNSGASKSRLGK
jgi:hypothetical protein